MAVVTALRIGLILAAAATGCPSLADSEPYAIRGLSSHTIARLEAGAGLGMAKAADLNGYPGPRHAIELAQPLALTAEQQQALHRLMDQMTADARQAGRRYLAAEALLEALFRDRSATEAELAEHVRASAEAKAQLRLVHLRAHLQTADLLDAEQRARYMLLRSKGSHAGAHQGMEHPH